MVTLGEVKSYIQDLFNDTSSRIETSIMRYLNPIVRRVKRKLNGSPFAVASTSFPSIASQQSYPLALRLQRVIEVKVTSAGVDYYPEILASRDQWDQLISNVPTNISDIPLKCFLDGDGTSNGYTISFYPTPASALNTIAVKYYARERQYQTSDFTDKTAGTVSIANGAAAVTGSGTAFAATDVGRYIMFDLDGYWYKVLSRTSTTSITLDRNYEGSTIAGGTYVLGTVLDVPEEAMEVVSDMLLERLWEKREDATVNGGKATYYRERAKEKMKELKVDLDYLYDSPTVNVLPQADRLINPNNFPQNIG